MNLTEQDLRQHLEAEAGQASPPRFAVGDLTGRIRGRRRRIIGAASACLATVAALAVALPVGLSGGASPGVPPPSVRALQFIVSVNGQRPSSGHALTRGFAVSPGERLDIEVRATIPSRARMTGLWLGISTGTIGASRTGPIGLRPVLADLRKHLEPGRHTFWLTWTVPHHLGDANALWLADTWAGMLPETASARSHQPLVQAEGYQYLAKFVLSRRAT